MIGGSSSFVSAPSFLNSSEIIFIISSNQHMSDLIHCSESFSRITDAFPNQGHHGWISLVLFRLVLCYYFQYPTRKFPSSTEFRELKYEISNSGTPVSFLGLRRDRKWPVLNGRELHGTGSGWYWVLGSGNFPDFFGKNLFPWKWHSGKQNSSLNSKSGFKPRIKSLL